MTKGLAVLIAVIVFFISGLSFKSIADGKGEPEDMLEKEKFSGCTGNCAACPSHMDRKEK